MIQHRIKLRITSRQERQMLRWLFHLTSVWNWSIKKIERDAQYGIYWSEFDMFKLLKGHSRKLRIPSHILRGTVSDAVIAWKRCFQKQSRKPRLKGRRNKLNSIPFPDGAKLLGNNRVRILGFLSIKFHKQDIPQGQIKCARVIKRASGWYLCLFIDTNRRLISVRDSRVVGIDPGFDSLITLSDGEKIQHPRELENAAKRISQAQRGVNRRLASRIHERIANQRKDRNHKLSHKLASENQFIAFSADPHRIISKTFGKSVASSGHYQLRQMLAYKSKCRTDGLGVYVEVNPKNSTKTCSACGSLTGPSGWEGLSVRQWTCVACGAEHDRDINAAVNTLIAGAGTALERLVIAV